MKRAKDFGFSNSYFWVQELNDQTILATLTWVDIPAEAWNKLRDNICNDTKIADDVTVYFDYLYINGTTDRFSHITVGDWRRLGFCNTIKNCITLPDTYIVTAANEYFYHNIYKLKNCALPPKRAERVIDMITKSHQIAEFKTWATQTIRRFTAEGMTQDEITTLFTNTLHDVYHPKC